jgi:hypothetical protein
MKHPTVPPVAAMRPFALPGSYWLFGFATSCDVIPAESDNPAVGHDVGAPVGKRVDYFRRSIVFNALRGGKFPRRLPHSCRLHKIRLINAL